MFNIEFMRVFKKVLVEKWKFKGKFNYDFDVELLFDFVKIVVWFFYCFLFLFVDKIIELLDIYVVGVKNIIFNEGFF